jgi:hypothetical protein
MTDNVPVEQLAPGLQLRRRGEILELMVTDLTRETVDAWVKCIKTEAEAKPDGSVLFWLQDVSACKLVAISPYLREKMKQMAFDLHKTVPNTIGYNALVLPRTVITQVANLFIISMPSRDKGKRMIFFERNLAVRWLESKVNELKNGKEIASGRDAGK